MKSPAKDDAPADRITASAYQPAGSLGMTPCLVIRSRRSTSIDSPSDPATPSRERRNEEISTIRPTTNATTIAPTRRPSSWASAVLATVTTRTPSTKTTNHGRVRGLSTMLAMTIGIATALAGIASRKRPMPTPMITVRRPSANTQVASELRKRRTEYDHRRDST